MRAATKLEWGVFDWGKWWMFPWDLARHWNVEEHSLGFGLSVSQSCMRATTEFDCKAFGFGQMVDVLMEFWPDIGMLKNIPLDFALSVLHSCMRAATEFDWKVFGLGQMVDVSMGFWPDWNRPHCLITLGFGTKVDALNFLSNDSELTHSDAPFLAFIWGCFEAKFWVTHCAWAQCDFSDFIHCVCVILWVVWQVLIFVMC